MAIDISLLEQKARGIVDALSKISQNKLTENISKDFSADFNGFRRQLIETRPDFEPLIPGVSIGTTYVDVLAYSRTAIRLITSETGVVE